jgi:hypothetical protein
MVEIIRRTLMTDKTSKPDNKKKRLPKGLRLHVRNLKQAAHKEGTIYRASLVRRIPASKAGE